MRGLSPPGTIVIATGLLLLASGGLPGSVSADRAEADTQALREQARRLIHENACRRAEAELAEGERFYLVLDPEQRSLTLNLRGAVLREVPLDAVEVGRAYRLLIERTVRNPVRGGLHRRGTLTPRRPLLRLPVEVPDGSDADTATMMLPPETETAVTVPRRFFLSYEDGVVLEFRTTEGGLDLPGRVADGLSTLFGRPELRLHLILDRTAAEALYRSVPHETDLLVR